MGCALKCYGYVVNAWKNESRSQRKFVVRRKQDETNDYKTIIDVNVLSRIVLAEENDELSQNRRE